MGKKKYRDKADNLLLTQEYLAQRTEGLRGAGYDKPKWIGFCEVMLRTGYTVSLYEAKQTVSKYITVMNVHGDSFKVRFSNHKPIQEREARGDCDFFVGRTHFGVTTTAQAIMAVHDFFEKKKAEHIASYFQTIGEQEMLLIDD